MKGEFEADGTFVTRYEDMMRADWKEPTCPKCGEPVQWILDIQAHVNVPGGMALAHARCTWLPAAFKREMKLSASLQANQAALTPEEEQ